LGGGNAMPKAVLLGLKKYPLKISAVCAMLDSGGSAGRLRRDYKIVSPGDIRRALLALADTSPIIENLFNYRFQVGELKDHNFANLFITALELVTNDYERTMKEVRRILKVKHEVLPSTLGKANLYAILENGKVISGETNIDIPKHNGNLRIKEVFLKPKVKAFPKTVKAIKKADLVVIGPGDLYSSLAQIFLTEGIPEAMAKTRAKKALICNLMTKYGETNNFSVADFASETEKYLQCPVDYVIYNNHFPDDQGVSVYKKNHPELLELVRPVAKLAKEKFLGKDLISEDSLVEHDPEKVARILISLLD